MGNILNIESEYLKGAEARISGGRFFENPYNPDNSNERDKYDLWMTGFNDIDELYKNLLN